LIRHISQSESRNFHPSNINFGLFPPDEGSSRIRDKKQRRVKMVEKAIQDWAEYLERIDEFLDVGQTKGAG
jgi:methylenetetrahydrofolate--tRNA-(uracil-5-)-methyltransferase